MTEPIETPRLLLRPVRADDWTLLRAIDDDPQVMATLGGLRSERESMGYALAQTEHWSRHGFGWWMAFERDGGDFVGRGGLRHLEVDRALEIEVGYAVVRRHWGRGYATEIAEAALRLADDLGVARPIGVTLTDNVASRRVLEKVGMAPAREISHAGLPHVLYERVTAPGSRHTPRYPRCRAP